MKKSASVKVGDLVQHVSGGPVMEVESVKGGYVRCRYHVGPYLHKRHCTKKEVVRFNPPPLRSSHRWRPTGLAMFLVPTNPGPVVMASKLLRCGQCHLSCEVGVPHEIDGRQVEFWAPAAFTAPCIGAEG